MFAGKFVFLAFKKKNCNRFTLTPLSRVLRLGNESCVFTILIRPPSEPKKERVWILKAENCGIRNCRQMVYLGEIIQSSLFGIYERFSSCCFIIKLCVISLGLWSDIGGEGNCFSPPLQEKKNCPYFCKI